MNLEIYGSHALSQTASASFDSNYDVCLSRHHQDGRWEARIGRHSGAKYHYLGTYGTIRMNTSCYAIDSL